MNRDIEADCRLCLLMALTPNRPLSRDWIDMIAKMFNVSYKTAKNMMYRCMALKMIGDTNGKIY